MELFRLLGTIIIDGDEAKKMLDDTAKEASSVQTKIAESFRKIGAAVATYFATEKIINFGKACIEAASDANAAESQFVQVFDNVELSARSKLSRMADEAGISENRMKASFTKIAAFAKTTGMDTEDALALSERAMVAVADSAAFYDRTLEETTESLQSFLKGNFENDAALGLSCTEITRNTAANKLYGKSFIELSESQKQLTLLKMVEDANKLSGAAGQAARESKTWTNQTGNLKQAWQDFKSVVGNNFLEPAIEGIAKITEVVQSCSELVPELTRWFSEHEETIKAVASTVSVLVTTYIGLQAGLIIQKITQGFQAAQVTLSLYTATANGASIAQGVMNGTLTISEGIVALLTGKMTLAQLATTGLATAQGALNAIMAANPIALVIAAIAALIAIGVALYQNWDVIKEKALELWAKMTETFGGIKDFVSSCFTAIQEFWVMKLKPCFDSIGAYIKSVLAPAFKSVFNDYIAPAVETAFNYITDCWNNILKPILEGVIDFLTGVFTGNWKQAWEGLLSIVKGIFNGVISAIETMVNSAIDALNKLIKSANKIANKIPGVNINIPTIDEIELPRLEKGGILEKGQIGFLEGSGAEAVVPLDQNRAWISALARDMEAEGFGGNRQQTQRIIELLEMLIDMMPETMRDAFASMKFDVNNREFARLVKAVN